MSRWSFIKSRYWRIGALLFVVFIVAGSLVWFQGRGPWYHGHSLQYWTKQIEWYQPKKTQREGREALRAMGEPAVARLMEIADAQDSSLSKTVWNWQMNRVKSGKRWFMPMLLGRLFPSPGIAQGEAVRALGEIGPAASNSVPLLDKARNDRMCGYAYVARGALLKMGIGTEKGRLALTNFLESMENTNSIDWNFDVSVLGELGTNARPAIPTLCRIIDSAKMPELFSAVQVVASVRIEAKQCVPALIHCFERGQLSPATMALRQFGESARPAIPTLRKHLSDANPRTRQFIATALERIMGKKEFCELLKLQDQAARDSDPAARERAVKSLEEIDRKAAAAPMTDEEE